MSTGGYSIVVENFGFKKTFQIAILALMKSLPELKKEASGINLAIRQILLGKNSFSAGLEKKIAVVTDITTLREKLAKVQREIRARFPEDL